ncbi:MAG: enoyl-CoA hydratase/isomerase family protein [Planctomycetaceae bacterium]
MTTRIELTIDRAIARVTFTSAGGVQVFSTATRARLADVVSDLEGRGDVRVVVFEAQGRTFIAGADIKEFSTFDAASAQRLAEEGQRVMQRIAELPAVTIAAVHAACAGGGCELALACDLRLMAASARIGLPEVSLGVVPGWGGTVRAVRLFGGAAARRMVLTGELLSAEEAARLGVAEALPDDQFREGVEQRIEQLLSRGPTAGRLVKRLIAEFEGPAIAEQLAAEAAAFAECFESGEAAEGAAAFPEKRPPSWKGEGG